MDYIDGVLSAAGIFDVYVELRIGDLDAVPVKFPFDFSAEIIIDRPVVLLPAPDAQHIIQRIVTVRGKRGKGRRGIVDHKTVPGGRLFQKSNDLIHVVFGIRR